MAFDFSFNKVYAILKSHRFPDCKAVGMTWDRKMSRIISLSSPIITKDRWVKKPGIKMFPSKAPNLQISDTKQSLIGNRPTVLGTRSPHRAICFPRGKRQRHILEITSRIKSGSQFFFHPQSLFLTKALFSKKDISVF